MQPRRRQPTRLPRPWDSPGENTGVGCHFLLQCMKMKSESVIAQSCLTRSDPMECSLPGSSVHGIFQARVLEWGAIAFSFKVKEWKVIFHATGNQKKVELDVLISDKTNLKPKMATRDKEGYSVQFSSVQSLSRVRLCHPMNRSTPGLPVHHQLPELTQTHAHQVGDAIQPSHPLSSPSPPAPNPSQHQGLR